MNGLSSIVLGALLAGLLGVGGWNALKTTEMAVDLGIVKTEIVHIKEDLKDVRIIIRAPPLGDDAK